MINYLYNDQLLIIIMKRRFSKEDDDDLDEFPKKHAHDDESNEPVAKSR